MCWECWERFPRHRLQRIPLGSDTGMHHGTCVRHVPRCMSGSLTGGGGENVPGIPGSCATRNFTYLARGPWLVACSPARHHLNQRWCITHWASRDKLICIKTQFFCSRTCTRIYISSANYQPFYSVLNMWKTQWYNLIKYMGLIDHWLVIVLRYLMVLMTPSWSDSVIMMSCLSIKPPCQPHTKALK